MTMQLTQLFLRYYPPTIRLQYVTRDEVVRFKNISLYHVSSDSNARTVSKSLIAQERLLHEGLVDTVSRVVQRLIDEHQRGLSATATPFQHHTTHRPHISPITNFACHKTGRIVATSSYDKTIKIIHPFDKKSSPVTLSGHSDVVYSIDFHTSPSPRVLSGSFDRTCRLWDVQSKSCLATYSGHDAEIVATKFDSSGQHFGSCSMDYTSRVWDALTETCIGTLEGHEAEVSCLAFHPDDSHIVATGSCDATVRLWDTRYDSSCFRVLDEHDNDIVTVEFDPIAQLIASAGADGYCRLWDVRTGKCLFCLDDHTGEISDAKMNGTGALIATCGDDGCAYVYDTLTGTRRHRLYSHDGNVTSIRFNPQGNLLLGTGSDGTSRVWNVFTGDLIETLCGHEAEVYAGTFTYDSTSVLTASKDNSIRVYSKA